MVGNQINYSYLDCRIISLQIFEKPDTSDNKVHWNMKRSKTHAYRTTRIDKTLENSTNKSESQKIYTSMACMSTNAEISRRNDRDS